MTATEKQPLSKTLKMMIGFGLLVFGFIIGTMVAAPIEKDKNKRVAKAPEPKVTTFIQKYPSCPISDTLKRDYVIDCIKAGNPMSDEEGEDLVKECVLSYAVVICDVKHRLVIKNDKGECYTDNKEFVSCNDWITVSRTDTIGYTLR